MNDDIKEMLELHIKNDIDLLPKNQKIVLDYITNLRHTEDLYNQLLKDYDELQEENERIKKMNMYVDKYGSEMEGKYITEKSKNEKAVEYIDVYLKNVDDIDINIVVVKDILNGRSDE